MIDHSLKEITGTDTIIMTHHPGVTTQILTIMIIGTGIGTVGQDPTPTAIDIGVTVKMTQEEAIQGLTTAPHAAVHLATEAPTHITTDETLHTVDPHPIEVSPEIAADQGQAHHINTTTEHQQDHLTAPDGWTGKLRTEITNKSPLMTHHLSTIVLMSKPVTQKMI